MTDMLYTVCPECQGAGYVPYEVQHPDGVEVRYERCGGCEQPGMVPTGVTTGEVRRVLSHLAYCKDDGATNGGAVYIDDSAFPAARALLDKLAGEGDD